jgi:outer membrane protein TolC
MKQNIHSGKSIIFLACFTRICFLSVLLLCGYEGLSQNYTLQELLEYSRQNYPSIKAKESEVKGADKKVDAFRTDYLPSIILQDQYTYSTNNNMTGSFYPNEGIGLSTTGATKPDNDYAGLYGSLASVVVDWRIFSFGKVRSSVRYAKQERQVAQADYENEIFQLQVRVADAYLLLLISEKLTMAQLNNLRRAASFRQVIRAKVIAGIRAAFDTSLANAEYAKAALQLQESRRNEAVQRLRLAKLSGYADKSIGADSMNLYSDVPAFTDVKLSQAHPLLVLSHARAETFNARARALRASSLPSISLVGSGLGRGGGISKVTGESSTGFSNGTSYQMYNYLLGAVLRWNLTGFVRSQFDYSSEKQQYEKSKYLQEEQDLNLKTQSGEADLQIELAREQYRMAPVQLEAARNSFIQAQVRYENGLVDVITLEQTLYLLNRAETDQYVSVNNLWRALLLKAAATGDFNSFLSQVKSLR